MLNEEGKSWYSCTISALAELFECLRSGTMQLAYVMDGPDEDLYLSRDTLLS